MQKTVLWVAFALALTAPAYGQGQYDTAKKLRQQFDSCVMASAIAQVQRDNTASLAVDINTIAELAFHACSTEERAIRAFLAVFQTAPAQIEGTIVRIRLDMKQNLRAVAANPRAYLGQ